MTGWSDECADMSLLITTSTLPFLMTDLAKLQKHVALIVVCYKLEVLHRGLRHSPIEVETVCIELQIGKVH